MKKKSVILIVTIILLLFFGIFFGVSKLIASLKSEKANIEKNRNEVKEAYQRLNEEASTFNQKKEEYDTVMASLYYTNVQEKNNGILKLLNEYDETIKGIIEIGNTLEKKCSISYTDNETTQKCNSYKISYERAIQVFKADVKRYNTLVENYNEWTKENTKYKRIEPFTSKYVK